MGQRIRVEVRLYASLEKAKPSLKAGQPFPLEIEAGAHVEQLVERLGIAPATVRLIFVNGVVRRLDRVLSEGDRVALFPLIGGG